MRKPGGDVLGNAVNIASRLESSAQPGSILVSEVVHERVKDAIHAREIGLITVKNISEPIRVFEPFEIALDLPAELDPLKSGGPATEARGPEARRGSTVSLDLESWTQLEKAFTAVARLTQSPQNAGGQLAPLLRQVVAHWERIRKKARITA